MIQQISALYEDHLHIGLLFDFLEIRPVLADPHQPVAVPVQLRKGLRLEGVSFAYPEAMSLPSKISIWNLGPARSWR